MKRAFVDPLAAVGSATADATRELGQAARDLGRTVDQQGQQTAAGIQDAYRTGGAGGLVGYLLGLSALPLLILALFYWEWALAGAAPLALAWAGNVVRTRGLRRLGELALSMLILILALALSGVILWFGGKFAYSILSN